MLVLFGGPAGAGKSTLAAAWCATRERAVHVQLDDVRNFIVAGLADPQTGEREQVDEQYVTSVDACCSLARAFLADGYDVAIDDVLEPSAFERVWRPALGDTPWHIVIVLPSLEATLQRSRARRKRVLETITRQQHAGCAEWPANLRLDTTALTVDESLGLARRRGLLP